MQLKEVRAANIGLAQVRLSVVVPLKAASLQSFPFHLFGFVSSHFTVSPFKPHWACV